MKKIKLNLDDLVVKSFEVLPAKDAAAGTVQGHNYLVTAPVPDAESDSGSLMWTQCGSCDTPATCTYCPTCDESYCNTACPNCGGDA